MKNPTDSHISEVIEMAWDDETSFDAIEAQTGLSEQEVITIMRRNMKPSSFRMWRKRVSGRKTKHRAKTGLPRPDRYSCLNDAEA